MLFHVQIVKEECQTLPTICVPHYYAIKAVSMTVAIINLRLSITINKKEPCADHSGSFQNSDLLLESDQCFHCRIYTCILGS